jgi:hypothetical protein
LTILSGLGLLVAGLNIWLPRFLTVGLALLAGGDIYSQRVVAADRRLSPALDSVSFTLLARHFSDLD